MPCFLLATKGPLLFIFVGSASATQSSFLLVRAFWRLYLYSASRGFPDASTLIGDRLCAALAGRMNRPSGLRHELFGWFCGWITIDSMVRLIQKIYDFAARRLPWTKVVDLLVQVDFHVIVAHTHDQLLHYTSCFCTSINRVSAALLSLTRIASALKSCPLASVFVVHFISEVSCRIDVTIVTDTKFAFSICISIPT